MIYSLSGRIVEVGQDKVAIDLGSIGYEVFVSRPSDFLEGEEPTLYTAEVLTQDDHYLVGFASKREKAAFEALTSVKGIGPKTALSALSKTDPDSLFAAIALSNANYLKKLPGIGPKAASQIILDLKGKLVEAEEKKAATKVDRYPGVASALKNFGFKAKEIETAIAAIPDGNNIPEGEALRIALQTLSKGKK